MPWQPGKSYYEEIVEDALIMLSSSIPLCSGYLRNRSTRFSGRLRYDFVIGTPDCDSPHLVEVHGEQHYRPGEGYQSDALKKRLAIEYGCPFLVIPYWEAYRVSDELLRLISDFLILPKRAHKANHKTGKFI